MKITHITPENAEEYTELVKNMKTFVKIFSPGCGHCQHMKADWEKLEDSAKNMAGEIQLMDIHADALDKIDDKRFNVSGFPTILLLDKEGNEEKQYTGDRSHADMLEFLKSEINNLKKEVSTLKRGKRISGGKKSKKNKSKKKKSKKKKSKKKKSKKKKTKKST